MDDEELVRLALQANLEAAGYPCRTAEGGRAALEILLGSPNEYFLVVTDVSMPDLDGLQLLSRIRERHPELDVIFITGHADTHLAIQALKEGAFDFFRKPFVFEELLLGVERARERQDLIRRTLEAEKEAERGRLTEAHVRESIATFAAILDAKNHYTRSHSERVASYSARLAKAIGLSEEEQERIRFGGRIHDIGKIGTPDAILDKPGPLTPEEWAIMRKHPIVGGQCLRSMGCLEPYLAMVELHHENYDGSGYPHGLVGEETPLDARIVKVADYYDAITSRRPYRKPMSLPEAIEFLRAEQGRLLDPEVTEIFIGAVPDRVLRDRAKRRRAAYVG